MRRGCFYNAGVWRDTAQLGGVLQIIGLRWKKERMKKHK